MYANHLEDLDINGWKILKWILTKQVMMVSLDSSCSEWGQVAGSCQHGNKPQGLAKAFLASQSLATWN